VSALPKRVEVPDPDDMDDLTFLQHIDKRHADETKTEKLLHRSPHIQQAWVGPYRAYHDYLHRINPGKYDHEHVWDEDDADCD